MKPFPLSAWRPTARGSSGSGLRPSSTNFVRNLGVSLYVHVLAQTTLRSESGKIDLDPPFEERTTINPPGSASSTVGGGVGRESAPLRDQEHPRGPTSERRQPMRAERGKRAAIVTSRRGSATWRVTPAASEKRHVASALRPDGGMEAVQLASRKRMSIRSASCRGSNTLVISDSLRRVGNDCPGDKVFG